MNSRVRSRLQGRSSRGLTKTVSDMDNPRLQRPSNKNWKLQVHNCASPRTRSVQWSKPCTCVTVIGTTMHLGTVQESALELALTELRMSAQRVLALVPQRPPDPILEPDSHVLGRNARTALEPLLATITTWRQWALELDRDMRRRELERTIRASPQFRTHRARLRTSAKDLPDPHRIRVDPLPKPRLHQRKYAKAEYKRGAAFKGKTDTRILDRQIEKRDNARERARSKARRQAIRDRQIRTAQRLGLDVAVLFPGKRKRA